MATFGIEPIASGCLIKDGILINEDALALQKTASIKQAYDLVNPIAFELPISPNIAAKLTNVLLTKEVILKKITPSLAVAADIKIIEGVGGWFTPLNDIETMADVVHALNIPTILIISIKLGCLNHALLTVAAMQKMQIPLLGWVANCMQPELLACEENISTLKSWIAAPCLGIISFGSTAENSLEVKDIAYNALVRLR